MKKYIRIPSDFYTLREAKNLSDLAILFYLFLLATCKDDGATEILYNPDEAYMEECKRRWAKIQELLIARLIVIGEEAHIKVIDIWDSEEENGGD